MVRRFTCTAFARPREKCANTSRESRLRNAGERGENRKCTVKVRRCLRPARMHIYTGLWIFRDRARCLLRRAGNQPERTKVKVFGHRGGREGGGSAREFKKNTPRVFTPRFFYPDGILYFRARYTPLKCVRANWRRDAERFKSFRKFHHSAQCDDIVARKCI